jgi:fructoselysine-6-P-deglycase FrlB-like protein
MSPVAPLALNEILRQPETLVRLIRRHDEISAMLAPSTNDGKFERLYAFGCGDGFFAAEAATRAFTKAGLHGYRGTSSLDFLQSHAAFTDIASLLLPISMSGNVDRTVEGLLAGQANNATGLAITNSSSGLLAKDARLSFQLDIEEPKSFMAGTITYTSSLTALFMVAAARSRGAANATSLQPLADQINDIGASLGDLQSRIADLVAELPPARRIYFLAGGSGAASARYAASKFVELTTTHTVPQDTEEFAHSNFWQFRRDDLVFVLHELDEPEGISTKTAAILREFGARVVEIVPGDPVDRDPDRIAIVNRYAIWSPLALSFPLQLVSYYWALKDGLDPDTRRHLQDDEFRFRMSRRLSRKTLVQQS